MADTTLAPGSKLEKWERAFFKEYVRESGFSEFMGTGAMNPIVSKTQLIDGGDLIHIPLVTALTGSGTGTGTLVDNEENLGNYNYDLKPYWHRHAVVVNKSVQHRSSFDILQAIRDMLMYWRIDDMRDATINALSSVVERSASFDDETGHPKEVFFSESNATQRNTWTANNQYRILFGNSESNYNATFATAIATVGAGDEMGAAEVTLMKTMAKRRRRTAKGDSIDLPSVRPVRYRSGVREDYVLFVGSGNFTKLKTDSTIAQANREARPRDVAANPIFQDGDLIYDGVIIREIPEITAIDAGINASTEPAYLVGAQALGWAVGQRDRVTNRKEDDYGFKRGLGTESLWSIEKLRYQDLDHGMITGFFYTA